MNLLLKAWSQNLLWFASILGASCVGLNPAGAWQQSADWPQWMGPARDNHWNASGLIERFPEEGPPVVWRHAIAGGYAGPAVVGKQVFICDYLTGDDVKVDNFQRQEFTGEERVLCLDAATGAELWQHRYPVKYSISYPAGPRCTPTVDEDRVYTLGAEGHLICFQRETGAILWQKSLKDEYQTKSPLWGFSAHPLIDGDRLYTLAGGAGTHLVALDKRTGKELWRSLTANEQGYSPPTLIEAGGVRQLIAARPDGVSGLNPETGEEYWQVPYAADNGSIIMSPVKIEDYLYVAGYSRKSLLLKLERNRPAVSEVWRDQARSAISPVNVQPLVIGQVLYGFDQNGELCAVEIPSGKRLWASVEPTRRRLDTGTAFLVQSGDQVWMFNELGELIISQLTPEGYREIDRAAVIAPTNLAFGRKVVWSMPAFAGTRIYLRNDQEIICLECGVPEGAPN